MGTTLTAIKLFASNSLKKNSEPDANVVEDQLQEAIQEIKNIIYELTPAGLERYGLVAIVRNYIQRINNRLDIKKIEINSFGEENKDNSEIKLDRLQNYTRTHLQFLKTYDAAKASLPSKH